MAHGNVISFLDTDDLWSDNKLELQLAHLAEDPTAEIVLGRTQLMRLTEVINTKHNFEMFSHPWISLTLGSAVFRKSAFDRVGFFDQGLYYADDLDWFMRSRELGVSMVIHRDVTLFCRRHQQNMTNQKELDNRYLIRMLKKSLDRRQQQNKELAISLAKLPDYLPGCERPPGSGTRPVTCC